MQKLVVIIGASGFLGENLIRQIEGSEECEIVEISRTPSFSKRSHKYCRDLSSKLLDESDIILTLRPNHVYLIGRPTSTKFKDIQTFNSNLQNIILAWSSCESLSRIDFMSSALVYPGLEPDTANKKNIFASDIYELFKINFEHFLEYLGTFIGHRCTLTCWRLPLLFGGFFDTNKHTQQFIYWFISQYQFGRKWIFSSSEDKSFGTSWLYVPDFTQRLVEHKFEANGYFVRNVSSGFFTYFHLGNYLNSVFNNETRDELKLYRSRIELTDELGMKKREISDLISVGNISNYQF